MAGTLRGKIDCWVNAGNRYDNAQCLFKAVYDFCKSHPNMTEIARNGGISGTASNVDYYDGTNPFKSQAWYVFRMNDGTLEDGSPNAVYGGTRTFPWYMYVQFHRSDTASNNYGTSPANPSLLHSGSSSNTVGVVLVQQAIPIGSIAGTSEIAWNGGGSLGANTKGTPVWKTTAGSPTGFQGSFVFPRSNNIGGSHSTNRENCSEFIYKDSDTPMRYHIIADDDNFLVVTDRGDDLSSVVFNYFGLYDVLNGVVNPYNMVSLNTYPVIASNTIIGRTTGAWDGQGGVALSSLSKGVRGFKIGKYDEFNTIFHAPDRALTGTFYNQWTIPIISSESPDYDGLIGEISFIKEIFGAQGNGFNNDKSRVFVGSNSANTVKLSIPWDGVTVPRTNFTRNGVSFP